MTKRLIPIFAATLMAAAAYGEERFDRQVRGDFFAGFAGNQEAMARAIGNAEAILAANPKHAEARVWYGAGLLGQSRQAFQSGDTQKGAELFARGQKEMDEAAALEPDNLAVLLPRGAVLMTVARSLVERSPQQANALMRKALKDYEYAYTVQKDELKTMGQHPAGELLLGIADANQRLGNTERASEFFDRILSVLPATPYAKQAALWKQTGSIPPAQAGCIGCHTTTTAVK
jgi:tetratricopeptide (TPR) repeat protein